MKYVSGQHNTVLQYLNSIGGWVLAGTVRSIQTPYGFIGFRGDRDCRDLVAAGYLQVKHEPKPGEKKKFAWVKFLKWPEEKETYHSPPKIIKRNPNPFQVSETVNMINSIPAFKEKAEIQSNSLFG